MAIITKKLTAKLIKLGSSSVKEVMEVFIPIFTTINVAAKAKTPSETLSNLSFE
tara:strand:- start:284 stop:445 length:162 start_codon:yes stop_codon:yes gene_type:complete